MDRLSSAVLRLLLLAAVLQQHAALARSLRDSSLTLRLSLRHTDFSSNHTRYQAMQLTMQRSSQRLSHLEHTISLITAAAASSSVTYKTSVAPAPGAFITSIALGTPPSPFTAFIDTGSDLVWRQCQPCAYCYPQSGHIFDPSSSSTYRIASCSDSLCLRLPFHDPCRYSSTCTYLYQYGDFSYTIGRFSYDTITIPDTSGKPQKLANFGFGCGEDNEGNGFTGASGIIGLGQGLVSLPSQLNTNRFSYCLQSITDEKSESPLFLGPGVTMASSHAQSTQLVRNHVIPSLYYVILRGISVGGRLLDIPAGTFDLKSDGTGGSVIDSGTTFTYLVTAAYTAVLSAFKSAIASSPVDASTGIGLCYNSTVAVPSLVLHFEGADLDLPSDNYFVSVGGLFCLAVGESSGINIIGNFQQQNFLFLYDREAQKLSFTPANCSLL